MRSSAGSTVLAYKGLDGIPLWVLFAVAIAAFVVFGVVQARKRK
ncbi:hypothetical protein [Streptomyces fructofermentans]|uniref:Uncharacterized protein n=1 Tax=Streptomyces fructofermentans TaxID=152141 RepID=A0A918NMJ4_9ACTN|nr:hypothetical protein [Streptomyces fructofermentans]GGX81114.1 hypothetical protein GCM10010515_55850 [Streptomyces fructofermentans]